MKEGAMGVKPYLVMFSVVYLLGLILSYAGMRFMNLDSRSEISVAILFVSAYVVSIKFIRANGRAPNKTEKWRLTWGSLIVSIVSSVGVLVAVTLIFDGMQGFSDLRGLLGKVSSFIWIGVAIFISVLYLLMLQLVYGWGASKYYEKVQRHQEDHGEPAGAVEGDRLRL